MPPCHRNQQVAQMNRRQFDVLDARFALRLQNLIGEVVVKGVSRHDIQRVVYGPDHHLRFDSIQKRLALRLAILHDTLQHAHYCAQVTRACFH